MFKILKGTALLVSGLKDAAIGSTFLIGLGVIGTIDSNLRPESKEAWLCIIDNIGDDTAKRIATKAYMMKTL